MSARPLAALLALALAACTSGSPIEGAMPVDAGGGPSGATVAARGDTVRVPLGGTVRHAATGVLTTLLAVGPDSRCPANANCVWAGDVTARLRLAAGSAQLDTTLHTNAQAGPRTATVGGYTVELFGLTPYPGIQEPAGTPVTAWLLVRAR